MSEVETFLAAIEPDARRADATALAAAMARVTGAEPRLWGSMIGFGDHHYRYDSGREGDTFRVGFAARKAALTLYLGSGEPMPADLLEALGKHTTGKGCLYLKKLADADPATLDALIEWAYARNAPSAVAI